MSRAFRWHIPGFVNDRGLAAVLLVITVVPAMAGCEVLFGGAGPLAGYDYYYDGYYDSGCYGECDDYVFYEDVYYDPYYFDYAWDAYYYGDYYYGDYYYSDYYYDDYYYDDDYYDDDGW